MKNNDADEKAQLKQSLERNRRKLEGWPKWMRQGSVGERVVREPLLERIAQPSDDNQDKGK